MKKPHYARVGVDHLWLIDIEAFVLTAFRLEDGRWSEVGVGGDERDARVASGT